MDMITQAAKKNKKIAKRKGALLKELKGRIDRHHQYIQKHGDDPPEIKALGWA